MADKTARDEGGDESAFGLRVPKSFVKPVTGFVGKMLDWLGSNPAVVILLALIGVTGWGFYVSGGYILHQAIPQHIREINEGYKEQADRFIEANRQTREDFARDLKTVTEQFAKDRERDREMFREIRELLREHNRMSGAERGTPLTEVQPE